MKTPSKKIIILLVIAVLIGITAYFVIGKTQKETYIAPETTSSVQSTVLAKDSDNDGLKDWEEQLWKTDPYNPDTDGDGTPDGMEIKQGRNPLLAGPNDKLDTNIVESKINTETQADLSETDKFSRDLFVRIVAAKNANQPPSKADLQKFLDMTISQELDSQKMKSFAAADFQVDIAETPEKIKAYGNILASILKKPPPSKLQNEVDVVAAAEADKNPDELKKLDGNIAAYNRIKRDLLALVVPKSAVSNHVALANAAAAMAWSITGLQYILTDPVKAVPGTAAYAENAQYFFSAIRAFNDYFKTANVTFLPEDDGYQFFDGV